MTSTKISDGTSKKIIYSDESVKINAAISGISEIYHRLIEHSAIDKCTPHNLFVSMEIHAEDLINICNAIDKVSGNHAATIKFNGKKRRIKTNVDAALQLNKSIIAIQGIFNLMVEKSIKGIPAEFELIVFLKSEAEHLVSICKYMQESDDITASGTEGVSA